MNKCSRCGAELMDNARFCTVCGATLADEFAYQQTPQQPVYEQQAPQNYKEYIYNQPGAYKPVPDNSAPEATPQQDTLYRQAVSDAKYREPQQINNVSYQQEAPNYGQGPQYSQNPQYQAPNYGQPAYDQGIQYQQPAKKGLGAGAIVGIIVGILALVAIVVFLVFALLGTTSNNKGSVCEKEVAQMENAIKTNDIESFAKLFPIDDDFVALFVAQYDNVFADYADADIKIISATPLTDEELEFYAKEGTFAQYLFQVEGAYPELTEGYNVNVNINGTNGSLIFCRIKGEDQMNLFAVDMLGCTFK